MPVMIPRIFTVWPVHSGFAVDPSDWMSVILVKPAASVGQLTGLGVSRTKSAAFWSVSCVPPTLRTKALLPLTVGKSSPGGGGLVPSRNAVPTTAERRAADGVDHGRRGRAGAQLEAAVVGDAGRVGLVAARLAALAVRQPVDRPGRELGPRRDRRAGALRRAAGVRAPQLPAADRHRSGRLVLELDDLVIAAERAAGHDLRDHDRRRRLGVRGRRSEPAKRPQRRGRAAGSRDFTVRESFPPGEAERQTAATVSSLPTDG